MSIFYRCGYGHKSWAWEIDKYLNFPCSTSVEIFSELCNLVFCFPLFTCRTDTGWLFRCCLSCQYCTGCDLHQHWARHGCSLLFPLGQLLRQQQRPVALHSTFFLPCYTWATHGKHMGGDTPCVWSCCHYFSKCCQDPGPRGLDLVST